MRARLYILSILVLVILSSTGLAVTFNTDFQAYTDKKTFDTCYCRDIEYTLRVINTGDFGAVFNVEESGWIAEYATLAPELFSLKPGQAQYVTVFVRIPCNVHGRFPLKTIISNDMNVEKSFKQVFQVEACSNIRTEFTYKTEQNCKCSLFRYNFWLTNPGVFE